MTTTAADIPLRNIWLLFLYASDLVRIQDQFEAEIEEAANLPDLVGRLLAHVVEQRLRRNLSRGYKPKRAILSRVRGRIDILGTTASQLTERGQVQCIFDEHTMDTPRNRLVRAALDRLAKLIENAETAHRCRSLSGDLGRMGVESGRPTRVELAIDQIGRNESADRIMVALAVMVFDAMIPTEMEGDTHLHLADLNEHLVRHLFEKAVGNALRLHLEPNGWRVAQGRRLAWPLETHSQSIPSILPGMQTDVELHHPLERRKIVIDTKFTRIFTSSRYREELLKSGYLYQLYTYLRTQETHDDFVSLNSEGMLLHPQTGGRINEQMRVQGHLIHLRTVDLTASNRDFEEQLISLVPP
ncbi:5-methylcytosine-specific restriction endonuclease system specificity protein McrC [Rhizobium leguminosarum]|uniref:5-methylcytosine-specific restriction endonuclease system specificity protein McrC n=1 Tax=Rhizobium leguminosarum TaxID=384 RepID=UPI00103110EE|nr:5-methylcytosine-specific restriction endonuclease system specificity protein McrC [Rhizobium leguminosarum]TAY64905.1 5-methylcytosine-specific restriction endonuclease system specificity protein McrC [Rhizobium leguminosarum]